MCTTQDAISVILIVFRCIFIENLIVDLIASLESEYCRDSFPRRNCHRALRQFGDPDSIIVIDATLLARYVEVNFTVVFEKLILSSKLAMKNNL